MLGNLVGWVGGELLVSRSLVLIFALSGNWFVCVGWCGDGERAGPAPLGDGT